MKNLKFPIDLVFKIGTFSNDFTATDANGNLLAYARQKMFKLKEDIQIFADTSKNQLNYQIKADRWLDFSAAYAFYDANGNAFGKIVRKGWRSIWKAKYQIVDASNNPEYTIEEENGWVKVADSLLGEIPVAGAFTGYLFNPSYSVTNLKGEKIARLKKQASFFGRKFQITKLGELDEGDSERIMLGLMMLILLERRRG
ncbi:hypothetical protein QO206_00375 [Leeuwenhoekiella aequorea]|uniref:hypothetical protein n=1 Tax=Leeuwenhoekiella aequorea TaxID=283736 RepID=UPI00352D4CCC|tara:strand:+ start:72 stop:668 length:597 start_codon:yes stop_codon:yes gene_type:complete